MIRALAFKKNTNFFAANWEKSPIIVIITSTPDRANIRLLGDCLHAWYSLMKFTEVGQILGQRFFHDTSYVWILTKNEPHFGRFFHKLIWGRCYDHNFRRFLSIFGEKNWRFLKNQCFDHNI
jgi:hypothetical protein